MIAMLFLQFYINEDRYVIDTRHIISVIPLLKMHKSASFSGEASRYLCGYIHYQDKTVPVVDLSKLIAGKKSKPYLSTRIVLINYVTDDNRQELLGFLVEKATEVIKLDEKDFSRGFVNTVIKNDSAPYLGPIAKNSDGLVQQLNINQLIELKVIDYIPRSAAVTS